MTIPPRFLEALRSRLTLSEVIGKRIKVTRAGREFKACCPFHKEKTPSFTINDDKQFFHCFGCGVHGDVVGFVMQYDNLAFPDAVEMLAAQAGLQMPKPDPQEIEKSKKAKGLHELMDQAAGWFEKQLAAPENQNIREYLAGRGLDLPTIQKFRVGFAPEDRQALRVWLKAEGFSDPQMLDAGVVKKSEKSPEPYVFFRERIMFPVFDRRGRVVAFGGRALPDHLSPPRQDGFKPPKYMNSSDTPLFDKGRMVYGENLARQAARDGKPVIVTEGYMDVIACHKAGFEGAVAPMGTALTEDQVVLLWSMIPDEEKVPVLCFDGDRAGQAAAVRACERILPLIKPGHSVKFAFMPAGEDPDSLIQAQGPVGFSKVLNASITLFEFLWLSHMEGRDFKAPESRAGLQSSLENQIAKIADRAVQGFYRQALREKISAVFFPRREARGRYDSRRNQGRSGGIGSVSLQRPSAPNFRLKSVSVLMAGVLNHPPIFEQVEEAFSVLEVNSPGLARLKQAMIDVLSAEGEISRSALVQALTERGFADELESVLHESVYVHAGFVRPPVEETSEDSCEVEQKWHAFFRSYQEKDMRAELKQGWKDAFVNENEESEERLKLLMQPAGEETSTH